MIQFAFGSGGIFGVRNDISNGTPIKLGVMQEISLDISYSTKSLFGQKMFALAIARGQGKITGKAKFAKLNGLAFASLFFGTALAAGQNLVADSEAAIIPASPYAVTVANAANFATDLGVFYTQTLVPLSPVTSGPAAGQYSVTSGGVYTFSAADLADPIKKYVSISYLYSSASAGFSVVVTNPVMGITPTFMAVLQAPYGGKQLVVKLPLCTSNKLSFATKIEDWLIPEMDFEAMDDGSGNVMYLNTCE